MLAVRSLGVDHEFIILAIFALHIRVERFSEFPPFPQNTDYSTLIKKVPVEEGKLTLVQKLRAVNYFKMYVTIF